MPDSNGRWTRAEVDAAVAKWAKDRELAIKNILELMDDFYWKWLAGDGGHPPAPIKGLTDQEATPAIKALDELWQVLPALNAVLDKVFELHKKLGKRAKEEELYAIQQLLEGESVKITTKTDYAQRGLLTPDEVTKAATPERILYAMVEAYAKAKTAVVKVGDAMRRLNTQLDNSTAEAAELRKLADALGEPSPELAAVEARVASLRADIMSDPLAVQDGFDRGIAPLIEPARKRLQKAKAERDKLDADLAQGDALIVSLKEGYARAREAYEERVAKVLVDNAASLPALFDESEVARLGDWLANLKSWLAKKPWRAIQLGHSNWRTQVQQRLAQCETVRAANAQPVERRRELRGLLDSLNAKAANTGLAEDEAVAAIYRAAHKLLYTRPTPLAEAEKLVADYRQAVG